MRSPLIVPLLRQMLYFLFQAHRQGIDIPQRMKNPQHQQQLDSISKFNSFSTLLRDEAFSVCPIINAVVFLYASTL